MLVTHRPADVRSADRIVVLDHGRIVDQGAHDELMPRGGTYRDLVVLQGSAYADTPGRRRIALTPPRGGSPRHSTVADSPTVYAFLDDGPHAGETVRIDPGPDGRPPREFALADTDGLPRVYELRGPHHNAEWWIFRMVRAEDAQDS